MARLDGRWQHHWPAVCVTQPHYCKPALALHFLPSFVPDRGWLKGKSATQGQVCCKWLAHVSADSGRVWLNNLGCPNNPKGVLTVEEPDQTIPFL